MLIKGNTDIKTVLQQGKFLIFLNVKKCLHSIPIFDLSLFLSGFRKRIFVPLVSAVENATQVFFCTKKLLIDFANIK